MMPFGLVNKQQCFRGTYCFSSYLKMDAAGSSKIAGTCHPNCMASYDFCHINIKFYILLKCLHS